MSGQINQQGIRAPASVPGPQNTVEQILQDYPELAPEIAGTVAWRDVGQPDRRSSAAHRVYPSRRPRPFAR